ncbi:LuxR C-terminal-related transcriptional regulator [Streptomyces sp. NPDC006356]
MPAAETLKLSRRAMDLLDSGQAPLLLASALHTAGQAHARGGSTARARELLHRANELGISVGADGLVEEVQRALRVAGGRLDPRKSSAESLLTPAERQIASLAARGMSNRSIARLLQVSLRNVESHLTHVYRKLRVDGRHDLTRFFPDEGRVSDPVVLHTHKSVQFHRQPQSA